MAQTQTDRRTQSIRRLLRHAVGDPPGNHSEAATNLKCWEKMKTEIKRLFGEHHSAMPLVHSKDLRGRGCLGGSASASRKQRWVKGYLVICVSESRKRALGTNHTLCI